MKPILISLAILGVSFTLGGLAPVLGQEGPPVKIPADIPPLDDPPFTFQRRAYDPTIAAKTVVFWEKAAAQNPRAMIENRELAAAYLARGRETADIADAVRAEAAARKSLEIHTSNNVTAMARLARAILNQHRFPEALVEAKRAAEYDPGQNRLIADIDFELGEYDAAKQALALVPVRKDDLARTMIEARLLDLEGDRAAAMQKMVEARARADYEYDMPNESVAWYHTMIGHALIDSGKLDEGETACRKALEIFPRDYRAMTGMAEAATARGNHDAAIAWCRQALDIAPQNPEAQRILGESYAAQGKTADADREFARFKALCHSFPRIYDRHFVLFSADHGTDLDEALVIARKDLELRHDAQAYDTLAWICFNKGLLDEAAAMSQKALVHGKHDAAVQHHAAEIAHARGDDAAARTHRGLAKEINPYLIPDR